jgi:hypothetical protein
MEARMTTSLLYRIASVLLVLFALGHTLGFRRTSGMEGADSVVALMQSVHFTVQGNRRAYWDFYVGFGLFVTVFLLFAAVLSWQLGGMSRDLLIRMPVVTWGFSICFAAVTILSWKYFFPVPALFSVLTTASLIAAAWVSSRAA